MDYIAPEQLQGAALDARTDVYALGCVMFQALTGRVPYPRDTEAAKMWAHMSEPPPALASVAPDLPPALNEVVSRAIAKQPGDRYPSAGDFARAAQAAVRGAAVATPERSVATGPAAPSGGETVVGPAAARPRRR